MKRIRILSVVTRATHWFLLVTVFAVATAFFNVAVNRFFGTVIDAIGSENLSNLPWLTMGIIAILFFVLKFAYPYASKMLSERIRLSFLESLGLRSAYGDQALLEKIDPGQATTYYTSDVTGVCNCVDRITRFAIPDVFLFCFSVVVLMQIDIRLGCTAVVASVIPVTVTFFTSKTLVSANRMFQKSVQTMNSSLAGELGSLEYVKANNLEEYVAEHCQNDLHAVAQAKRKLAIREAVVGMPMFLCPFITIFAIAAVGGVLVVRGTVTIGQLFSAIALADNVISPVMRFDNTARRIRQGSVCLSRLESVLHISDEPVTSVVKTAVSDVPLTLSVRNLSFAYASDRVVFQNASFSFTANGLNLLVGENGAGKSTFAKLLCGIVTPSEGEIMLAGDDLPQTFSVREIRDTVVVDPQRPVLFAGSLRSCLTSNITVNDEVILELCRKVGLADDIAALPDGLDTQLTEEGGFLSGGQKRRISFVGALLRKGRIYLFDEPTAGVDDENAEKMIEMMVDLASESLVIAISHDPRLISRASHTVRLEGKQ